MSARSRGIPRTLIEAAVLAGSYAAVRSPHAQVWDRRAGRMVARPLGRTADRVISTATDLGSVFGIAGVACVLALGGRRRAALDVVGTGALAWTAAQAVKPLIDRPRPYQADGLDRLVSIPAGTSWPSGHVSVAAGMSAVLAPRMPAPGRAGAAAATAFVAASRIYVGVHYLTDVVAGAVLGSVSARLWTAARRGAGRLRASSRR